MHWVPKLPMSHRIHKDSLSKQMPSEAIFVNPRAHPYQSVGEENVLRRSG